MKTIKEKFEFFKKRCIFYQKLFNLYNYEFYFLLDEEDDENRAFFYLNLSGRTITIHLCKKWLLNEDKQVSKDLDKVAFHELFEIFIGRIVIYANNSKLKRDEFLLNEMSHDIVRTAENVIYPLIKKEYKK